MNLFSIPIMEFVRQLESDYQNSYIGLFKFTVYMQFALAMVYLFEVIWKIFAMRWGFFRDSKMIFILEIPF